MTYSIYVIIIIYIYTITELGFSTERLEDWFNTSVVTNLSQEVGQDISNLIVSYARISSLVASHDVENTEPQQHL